MSSHVSLVLSAVAICLSIVSLTFTAYQQYFKRPAVSALLPLKMSVCYEHDGRLYMSFSVLIRNKGAQYASIRALGGRVSRKSDGSFTTFHWTAFLKDENIARTGEAYRPITSVEQIAELLVVPNRTAVTKKIQFITDKEFTLSQGVYTMELWVFEGLKSAATAKTIATFNLSDADAARILRMDKETHLVKQTVSIPLKMEL